MTSPLPPDLHRVDRLLQRRRAARGSPRGPVLQDGARVAIVGAGPAGSFAVHYLRRAARERGIGLHMTIFDAKDFSRTGPPGCNMCAGVVTASLVRRMEASGLRLPEEVVQHRVRGFRIITRRGAARVTRPDAEGEMITVFRGNGPRFRSVDAHSISFDDALLSAVRGPNLEVIREPVTDIRPPRTVGEQAQLSYGRGEAKERFVADAVIGAFGVSPQLARRLSEAGVPYRPPRTVRACQAELLVGRDYIRSKLRGEVQVFSLGLHGIALVAMVPKGDYLTTTMVGRRDLGLEDLLEFLDHPRVRARLPSHWEVPRLFCHCHPGIVVSAGAHPYADRLVMVGDAACSRYYKNGMETAHDTAAIAAYTLVHEGVSARALRERYVGACRRLVTRDNRYGRALFFANRVIAHSAAASRAFLALSRAGRGFVSSRMREVLWGIFAGDRPYRTTVRRLLHPRLVAVALWQALVHTLRGR